MGNAHPATISHSRPRLNRSNRLSDYDAADQKTPLLDDAKPQPLPPCKFLLEDNNRPPNYPPPADDHRLADRIVISQLKLRVSILEFLLNKQGIDLEEMTLHKSATDKILLKLTQDFAGASNNHQHKKSRPPPPSSSTPVPDLIDMDNNINDDHNKCHSLPPFDPLFVNSNFTMANSNHSNYPDCSVHREIDWHLHFGYLFLIFLLLLSVGFLL